MKRRINVEQLNELTDKQRQNLRDWWKPDYSDVYFDYVYELLHFASSCSSDGLSIYSYEDFDYKENCLPLLDIGQMIEFIYEYDNYFDIDSSSCTWYLDTRCIKPNIKTDGQELCDALWDAVKRILEVYSDGK